ncbi:uroporphyrinogen-III synthase-like isoform X1 [Tribolium madens]|uniref:uroporphyrinogen-III synthase-like isoform X1 n=1 Tax=Tribolium madens TaxID=41895 RepID=UPI001CF75D9F|nr:uroporphyrinogen-III synthase-like isoform X1 [Tribolium madens]
MTLLKNTVLLLKSDTMDDKYTNLLKATNFKVMIVKTLVFQYKNLEMLREKLLSVDNYSGILLSSPRCVSAVNQTLEKKQIQELWGHKSNFTVGESTYKEAQDKLGVECQGKESGNAKNLSQIIIQNKTQFTKPFLFPHGNLKTDTLKLELGKENVLIEEVLVYDTLPNPDIGQELSECTNNFTDIPEFIIYFSPSGLHSSIKYLRKLLTDCDDVKIIAIGPVTELALQDQNLKVHAVAKSPTPEEILNTLT